MINLRQVQLTFGVIRKCLHECVSASGCEGKALSWCCSRCGVVSLRDGGGRGDSTAAEKQLSLQSLICKYANERVIKIGRLSVALWLLMNSNLQERGRGRWEENEQKEEDGGVHLYLPCENRVSSRILRMHVPKKSNRRINSQICPAEILRSYEWCSHKPHNKYKPKHNAHSKD